MRSRTFLGLSAAAAIALVAVTAFMASNFGTTDAAVDGASQTITIGGESGEVTLDVGADFIANVNGPETPQENGYVLAQTYVIFDEAIITFTDSRTIWADCEDAVDLDADGPGFAQRGCLTGLIAPPPSFYKGELFQFDFTCSVEGTTTIEIVQEGTAPALTNGAMYTEHTTNEQIRPSVDEIIVNCGAGGEPTDTPVPTTPSAATDTPVPPTNTPVPPTATPSDQPCGDVNGDDAVSSVDALWVLWFTADLVDALEKDGDINGDGNVTAVDAALILQIDANLYSC